MRPRIITAWSSTARSASAARSACSPRSASARLIERPPAYPCRRGSPRRSNTSTRQPRRASRVASRAPARPAPMMVREFEDLSLIRCVPAVIPAKAGIHCRKSADDSGPQVPPFRVAGLYLLDLPAPVPFLDPLLAQDPRFHRAVEFEPHQARNAIPAGEALHHVVAMLPDTLDHVAGDADVEGALRLAREDVDGRLLVHKHDPR